MPEQTIGSVTHYFDHLQVAVIKLTGGDLKIGDQIHVTGKDDFQQTVDSMQVDREPVDSAVQGSEVAIKVSQPVKKNDQIVKVMA